MKPRSQPQYRTVVSIASGHSLSNRGDAVTAVVAAYVLAGELAAASGGYRAAFARYEHLLRGYVARGQKQALGGRDFLAPATEKKIRQRDRFFRMLPYLPTKGLIRYLSTRTATAIKLPGYL